MSAAKFLTATELAGRWGYAESTLRAWRRRKKGPRWSQPGGVRGKVLYALADVEAFERKNGMTPKDGE